jgi:hypothetical protein
MSTAPHPIAPEEIMAHLDGELPANRSQSVSAHLESCTHCQTLVTSFRNTSHSLFNWTVPDLPTNPKFEGQLSAAVESASSKPLHPGELTLHDFLSRRWKLLSASVVLAVLLIMIVGSTRNRYEMSFRSAKSKLTRRVAQQDALANRALRWVAPKGESSADVEGPPFTDQQSKVGIPPRKPPLESGATTLNTLVTLATPGVAADSNGLVHGLGDHAQSNFSLDGQPKTEQLSRVFTGPMISRTISLSLITKDFDSSRTSLDVILTRHNGYSAELNVATPQNAARSLQASLRVPAPQLTAALAELKSLGRVENESQTGDEVTQQHADLVARLKNSRETEQRLQAILTERTGKIKDVLEVEQEIARVRGEIEEMEAEQKNLEHRVDFATIDLKLSEEYKAKLDSPAPAISTLIHNAAINGYRNVADTILSLVLFLAEFGPVLLLWAGLLFVPGWFVWRCWRHSAAAI